MDHPGETEFCGSTSQDVCVWQAQHSPQSHEQERLARQTPSSSTKSSAPYNIKSFKGLATMAHFHQKEEKRNQGQKRGKNSCR